MYLGSPQITSYVDPLDSFPERCCWSGMDEALPPRGVYRGARRDINGDSPVTLGYNPRYLKSSVGMLDVAMKEVLSA